MAPKRRHAEEQPVASSSRTKIEEIEPNSKRRRKAPGSGPVKNVEPTTTKRGLGNGVGSTEKTTAQERRDLILLHTMPFDVVYEILAYLSAKDLLSVSRVNKEWCRLLSSKSMVSLWKQLRQEEGIPEPHPDISEASWAYLVAGGNCEVCGVKAVQMPDFGIRRRVCWSCKKQKLVVEKQIRKEFAQYDNGMIDLLPSTKYDSSGLRLYWPDDVHEIGEAWTKLQANVKKGLPNAQSEAQAFREQRLAILNAIEASRKPCMDWCRSAFNQQWDAKYKASKRRLQEIFRRFRGLGYTDIELNEIWTDNSVTQGRELTERIWNNIKPKLEEKMWPRKRTRLMNERGHLLTSAWESFTRSITPIDRLSLPLLEDLYASPAFETLARALDVNDDSEVVSDLAQQLPQLASTWQVEYKDRRRINLLNSNRFTFAQNIGARVTTPEVVEVDLLEAAVFPSMCYKPPCSLSSHGAIFGWKSALQHRDCRNYRHTFQPLGRGNEITTDLIHLAGLDPRTVTWEDMDQSSLRVVCKICLESPNSSREGSLHKVDVYTWRQAVVHVMLYEDHTEARLYDWQVLDPTQLQSVFERHDSETSQSKAWSCNHCHDFFTNSATINEVREHLVSEHNISKPVFPDDLLFFPLKTRSTSFELKLWTESNPPPPWRRHGRFACNRCDECWFALGDLEAHIRKKHGEAPTMDENDYTVRKYWEGYTPPPNLSYP